MKFLKYSALVVGASFLSCGQQDPLAERYANWSNYRGTKDSNQYSSLSQINVSNVKDLQVAWTYQCGDADDHTTIECNPIVVDGVMYVTTPRVALVALDAETGQEIWKFEPFQGDAAAGVNRGVAYWSRDQDKRILLGAGHRLFAINAQNGQPVAQFGQNGSIDLRENLYADTSKISISLTTPGIIYNDLIIIGSATGEGYNASPGHIRAYDVVSGKMEWIFHTIPRPGEFGYDTWKFIEGENYGGTNNWTGMSLDEERGWVFATTGSPTYDFYGANRLGTNLFGNCVIALDAQTGERIWHFQTVRHDLWDYDHACAPNLATINFQGEPRDVVLQPTKTGMLFVLDRETGQPLVEIPELPVPPSDVPGESAYPTQLFPQELILTPQGITEQDLTDISPEAHGFALEEFKKYRNEGMYTPPGKEGTLTRPSTRGGVLWGGASFDPYHNMLYVNANENALILQVARVGDEVAGLEMKDEGQISNPVGRNIYLSNCSNCHGTNLMGMPPSFPSLRGLKEKFTSDSVIQHVRSGKGLMPGFTQFTPNEMSALAAFLLGEQFVSDTSELRALAEERYVLQGFRVFVDQEGYPATKPPWGTLIAVDMDSRKIKWKVPLGEYDELTERGISVTGTQLFGGAISTAGGVIFTGATDDERFRAFDQEDGKLLWEYDLPAGGYATPSTYQIKGKQYVVIAAGGGSRNGSPSGDSYVTFALPD